MVCTCESITACWHELTPILLPKYRPLPNIVTAMIVAMVILVAKGSASRNILLFPID
jgi:hypothetical protein